MLPWFGGLFSAGIFLGYSHIWLTTFKIRYEVAGWPKDF
jgi:hypothetical protein